MSLRQEGFPTLFCGNLPFRRVLFSTPVPDRREEARTVLEAGGRNGVPEQQSGERPLLGTCAREPRGAQAWNSRTALTCRGWAAAGCPPKTPPLSLPFLLSQLQRTAVFYLFLCLALSASPFLFSPSSPLVFSSSSRSVCASPLLFTKNCCYHPPLPAPGVPHPSRTLSNVRSSTTPTNLVDELDL